MENQQNTEEKLQTIQNSTNITKNSDSSSFAACFKRETGVQLSRTQAAIAVINLSVEEIIEMKSETIGRLDRVNAKAVRVEIVDAIKWLMDNLNIQNKMTVGQVQLAAELIVNKYRELRTIELIKAFSEILTGGRQTYNKIDISDLTDVLNKYVENRLLIIEKQAYQKHNQAVGGKEEITTDEILKVYEKLKSKAK